MKKIKLYIWTLIILAVIYWIITGWWNGQFSAVSSDGTEKTVSIITGDGISQVADKLKNAELIRSTWAFKLRAKQLNLNSKLVPGDFKVTAADSMDQILKILTNAAIDNRVTLLEGWRVEEMAEKLNQVFGTDKKEFLKLAKEGYMFPDTYIFSKDFTPAQIAQRLRDNFDQKFTADLKKKILAQGLTENEGVILASIVEREARTQPVRTKVASILLKRLKIGMGLNVDASIQYALGYQSTEKSWWKRYLTRDDLQIDSPYNTYIHVGLPPAPICNPSLSSLQAVADADSSTPDLYYYHDLQGNSYYARTLEEHDANIANHP